MKKIQLFLTLIFMFFIGLGTSWSNTFEATYTPPPLPPFNGECDLGINIPDYDCTNPSFINIVVDDFPNVPFSDQMDLIVDIFVLHPYVADLEITLVSPAGTEVELTSDNGFTGDNFGSACDATTTFDMTASTSISDISSSDAPFVGEYIPEGDFANFNGEMMNGVWQIKICDDASGDIGTLEMVKLSLVTNGLINGYCSDSYFSIEDQSCSSSDFTIVDVVVGGTPGTVLGNDVVLDEVGVFVEHTYVGDLEIYLVAPNGTEVLLTSDNGNGALAVNFGSGCDALTRFSMDAGTSITSIIPSDAPFINTYIPQGDFADFDGSAANGNWRIKVCDDAGGDIGGIKYVEMSFQSVTSVEAIEDKENEITVFPNPSNGQFNLEWKTDNYSVAQVVIRDIVGRMVYSSDIQSNQHQEINLNNVVAGFYLVQILTEDRILTKKIQIN